MIIIVFLNNGKFSERVIFFYYKVDGICVWKLEYGLDMYFNYRNFLIFDY